MPWLTSLKSNNHDPEIEIILYYNHNTHRFIYAHRDDLGLRPPSDCLNEDAMLNIYDKSLKKKSLLSTAISSTAFAIYLVECFHAI